MKTASLIALAGVTMSGAAQPLVVPSANTNTSGGVSPTDTPFREFARTHQQVIAASHLASIPIGSSITQITLRASNFGMMNALGPWPAASLSFPVFEVYLGRAAAGPGNMSTSFAANIMPGSEARVRSGSLAVPAGAFNNFVASPGANPWGLDIQLSPFVYTGGDLVLTIRHSGHQVPQTPRLYIDSASNVTSGMQCMTASAQTATVGTPGVPMIFRVRYVPPAACAANCDGSSTVPILTANDFLCFINQFSVGFNLPPAQQVTCPANCDGSTSAPVLNIGDFVCFNARFAAGCN